MNKPPSPLLSLSSLLSLSTSLQLKCSPSIVAPFVAQKVPVYEQETDRARNKRGTPERGGEKKNSILALRMKYLRGEKKKTQCNVFYCVQVTPSIKSEINLDVIYKEQLQRKGRGVTVIFQKTWESCFFFFLSLLVCHTCCRVYLEKFCLLL